MVVLGRLTVSYERGTPVGRFNQNRVREAPTSLTLFGLSKFVDLFIFGFLGSKVD